ncbi:MAG: hypothetical protein ACM3RX_05755 [Methanococcaceae archaeon]
MARLKGQIMGKPKGKVGDIVFKSLYGNTLIVSAPTSFRAPMDEASVTRRTKFRFVVKLSAAIIRLLSVKILWKKSVPAGQSGYSYLLSNAYRRVGADLDISAVKLINKPQFVCSNPAVVVNANSIKVDMDALGAQTGIDPNVEKTASLEGVVYLSSPTSETDAPYQFIPFSSQDLAVDISTALSFTVPLVGADAITFGEYSVKKILATLVTKDADGNPVKASVTFFN